MFSSVEMKRSKGLASLDPVAPVLSNNRLDQQSSNDIGETAHATKDNRKSKNEIDDISKIATSTRPKFEILRANSPTFKRLGAVRIKLDRYVNSISNTISPSQPFVSETSNYEKPSTATTVHKSSASSQRIKSKRKPNTAPLDKITYENTWTHNGNVKQKCSLEIWLPKASLDDEDGNTSRTTSPDAHVMGNDSQSVQSMLIKSRRSSVVQFSVTTIGNSETKSLDETSAKKSEQGIIPRVYHYEDYLTDQSEERPRSGKSGNTNKSDGNRSSKTSTRQRTRPNLRRQSPSSNNTDETVQSATSVLPMSSKNLLLNIKQTYTDHEVKGTLNSNSSTMINELMRKYSMIKKSHKELTQPRLQLEKASQDSKHYSHTTKDHSLSSPPASDSASRTSSEQPLVAVRKLLGDTASPRSAGDHTNTKAVDRHSSRRKPPHVDMYPHARVFSLVNHLQYRQTSTFMPTAILPVVTGRKNEEPLRSFERSKTLDVVFTIPTDRMPKIPSRLPARAESPQSYSNPSNFLPSSAHRNEKNPPRSSKRSLPPPSDTLRSEQVQQQTSQPLVQLVQYQNIQNTAQRYHLTAHPSSSTTTDLSTNKVLVHLKYSNSGNTDRHCLIPE